MAIQNELSGHQPIKIASGSPYSNTFALGGVAFGHLYVPAGFDGIIAFAQSAVNSPGAVYELMHRVNSSSQMEVFYIDPNGLAGWVNIPVELPGGLWTRIVSYQAATFNNGNLENQSADRSLHLTYTMIGPRS